MKGYYPLFLKISGKRCVVVGGGGVALRKVDSLLEHGADVTVVSPDTCPQMARLAQAGMIRLVQRGYQSGDLAGALLVIAATDDRETNLRVSRDAAEAGALVNVVDDAEISDFIVPSVVRRGDLTIAISTSGKSPALARKLRAHLETSFGEEYAALVDLVEDVRREVKPRNIDAEDWQKALDLDLLAGLIREGKTDKARDRLLTALTSPQSNRIR